MNRRRVRSHKARPRGVAAVVFLAIVPVLVGMVGLAIDLSRLFSRKTEMQQIADAIALAAATRLDGTAAGAVRASNAAGAVATAMTLSNGHLMYYYWTEDAVLFGKSPDAADTDWQTKSSVTDANAPDLLYVKVDTSKLLISSYYEDDASLVEMAMASFLPGVASTFNVYATAVAGKLVVPITPLAVCAMTTSATGSHTNNGVGADPVKYGFRTGVSYNLLKLNPTYTASNSTAGLAWMINPIDPTDHSSIDGHFDPTHVKPFVCAGKSALGHLIGREVYLKQITGTTKTDGYDLTDWLNSRFGTTTCNAKGAPPDSNVREYYSSANGYTNWYMQTEFAQPVAEHVNSHNKVIALPDVAYQKDTVNTPLDPPPGDQCFGPLWAYSKPAGNFTKDDWPKMYQFTPDPKSPKIGGPDTYNAKAGKATYPQTVTPYFDKNHRLAPAGGGGVDERRVLNIPLLDCSAGAPSGKGKVLAVGRFFMTGKATDTVIPGEFAGTVKTPINGAVLYR